MVQLDAKKEKAKAWKEFSLYIRYRDCLATTGTLEYGRCISCQEIKPIKSLQAGHLVPGRHDAYLFDEDGVNAQCARCNGPLKGNTTRYRFYLVEKIGEHRVKKAELRGFSVCKYSSYDYFLLKEEYRQKKNSLLKGTKDDPR